jgi:uncharacterized coiled-coil DUF342 family protein
MNEHDAQAEYHFHALRDEIQDVKSQQESFHVQVVSKLDDLQETHDRDLRDPDNGIHAILRKLISGASMHMVDDKTQHIDFRDQLKELYEKISDVDSVNKELNEKLKTAEVNNKKLLYALFIIGGSSLGTSHFSQIIDVIKVVLGL